MDSDKLHEYMDQQLKEQLISQGNRLNQLEVQQKSDSVVLIKLDTKFDYLANDIKQLVSVINERLGKAETTNLSINSLLDRTNLPALKAAIESHEIFIQEYKSTNKERNMIIAFVLSILSILLTSIGLITGISFKLLGK
jgi:hypothetical protein